MTEAYFGFPGNGVQSTIYFDRKNIDTPENQKFLEEINNVAQCDLVGKMLDKRQRKFIVDEKEIQVSTVGSSYLLFQKLKKKVRPQGVVGLSLGEVTSTAAAESLDPFAALLLARERADAMARCALDVPKKGKVQTIDEICKEHTLGKYMASITDVKYRHIERVCNSVTRKKRYGSVFAANENTPKQTVISGAEEAVDRAAKILKRVFPKAKVHYLKTGGPWHNPDYMSPAKGYVEAVLDDMDIKRPKTNLYLTSMRRFVEDPIEIKKGLVDQMDTKVKFWSSLMDIVKSGYKKLIDVGPGRVLKGFFEHAPAETLDKDKILEED